MKKIISTFVIACSIAGMVACGGSQNGTGSSADSSRVGTSQDSSGALQNNGSMTDTSATSPGSTDTTRHN